MICPKCGHEAAGNYCNNCGAPLYSEDTYFLDDPVMDGEEDGFEQLLLDDWENEESYYKEPDSDWQEIDLHPHKKAASDIQAPFRYKEPGVEEKAGKKQKEKKTVKKTPEKKTPEKKASEKKVPEKPTRKPTEKIPSERKRPAKGITESKEEYRAVENRSKRKRILEKELPGPSREKTGRRPFFSPKGRVKTWAEEPELQSFPERAGRNGVPEIETDGGKEPGFTDKAVNVMKGLIVVSSRLMQIVSVLLMVSMVVTLAYSFWTNGQGLGSIHMMAEEKNYGLALYLAFAGISIFMGVIWCFWILSRKAAGGGGVRLKRYDTGRGFLPFLICGAVIYLSEPALGWIPSVFYEWEGIQNGAQAALTAVSLHSDQLLFSSLLGAALSLIRKILSV
ncbi:MAG: hypothetical protein KH366_20305 [Clostridiaceae bacterium]|nr:hypothetical protein [Clostridiaceae bacterium]